MFVDVYLAGFALFPVPDVELLHWQYNNLNAQTIRRLTKHNSAKVVRSAIQDVHHVL